MAENSKIEWTDASWNPIVGCSVISPGCTNCYAMGMAARLERMLPPERRGEHILPHHYTALTSKSKAGAVWTGRVNIAPDHILTQPLKWRKPRRIFVNSMGDLFHESVPFEWIDRVFAVMALCPQHTFQVLTKRAERMKKYFNHFSRHKCGNHAANITGNQGEHGCDPAICNAPFPLPNVWLGVSVEDQARANERIPHLLDTPAAVRFISAEPLLGPVNLEAIKVRSPSERAEWSHYINALRGDVFDDENGHISEGESSLDWVIVGGESGPKARPMHPDWVRSIRDQCEAAGTAFFFKQWGEWHEPSPGEQYDTSKGRAGNPPAFIVAHDGTVHCFRETAGDNRAVMIRVGKKAAGRTLDGRLHDEFPSTQVV